MMLYLLIFRQRVTRSIPSKRAALALSQAVLSRGLKNCVRIGILCLIGRAVHDSCSTHEVRRQMIEGDDVLAAKHEGMLHGVFEFPHIAGPDT